MLAQSGSVFYEPLHAALEPREFFDDVRVESLNREEWNEPDHGTNLEPDAFTIVIVQHVVVKPVLAVPQLDSLPAEIVHCFADINEVLEKLAGHVLVGGVFFCQFERDRQHVETIHAHPARGVGLLDVPAGGQRSAAIKNADVVEAEKAALKDVPAFGVLAIDPPGKVQKELVEDSFEKVAIAISLPFHLEFVH